MASISKFYLSISLAFGVSASILGASHASANPGEGWVMVGSDMWGTSSKVYVMPDQVQDWGDGNFFAPSFTDHGLTVRGIDFPSPNGSWYNTSYPHRSVLEWNLYDCERRLIANSETHYFSGDQPSSKALVYMAKEGEPLLFPEIGIDPVMQFICN